MKGFDSNKQSLKNKNNIFDKDRLITYALEMHQKGNINGAKICYEKILKKGIADPRVFTNLGLIFQMEKDYERAIKFYKKSINSFPESHEAYSNLSRILLEIGQYDSAEKYLIKVIKLKPDFLMAYQNLFNLYIKSNKRKKAGNVLQECLKIAPNNPLIVSNIGRFLLEEDNLNEAKKYIKRAISLKPDFWIPYNNLANFEATIGNVLEAEKKFHKVIEINPNYVEAYVSLGEIKNDLFKINEAETFFLKSLEIRKDYVNGYCSLFRFYEKTNNLIKLKEQLNIHDGNPVIKNELLMYRARVLFREKNFSKAKELIDEVSLNWVQKTDSNTRLNFWSFKGFIEEKTEYDIYLNDLDITIIMYETIKTIENLSKNYENNEKTSQIDIKTDWNIYLSFIESGYMWASMKDIYTIYNYSNIYEGNFIKNIIKLNNICENIKNICEIIKNYDLLKKLEKSEEILLRDQVTLESLYIK